MAPGRAPPGLALALALACWCPAAPAQPPVAAPDDDDALVSAPPELLALVPGAARATVSAGYLGPDPAEQPTRALPLPLPTAGPSAAATRGELVLIVGDTRYAWQEWSQWHCNCRAGSMARVRDITYAVPGVRLDPAQFDVLRLQREVCSYAVCACSRRKRECDLLALACELGEMHLCALRDIQRDQDEKRRSFWARVHAGLKRLWRRLKEAFPASKKSKAAQVKSTH